MLIAALTYALHLISFPAGWSAPPASDYPLLYCQTSRPCDAAMAANGAVAVALGGSSASRMRIAPQRLLVVRADGSSTLLRESPEAIFTFRDARRGDCSINNSFCPYFPNVVLADDGTPFVTLSAEFEGAYSGESQAALVWDGAWHEVPARLPFTAVDGFMPPTNASIAAATTRRSFVYIGNYYDAIPDNDHRDDPHSQADVSGVTLDSLSMPLGFGDATAMRGRFVAGFDADLRLLFHTGAPIAVRWQCAASGKADIRCHRMDLGSGIAYGVDSHGNVVGDDEPSLPDEGARSMFFTLGKPVLWRNGKTIGLSSRYGAAYAINDNGTIVGTTRPSMVDLRYSGFIANAHDRDPRALPIDPLVANLHGRHVLAAFGVSNDGRILALVGDASNNASLAILMPR